MAFTKKLTKDELKCACDILFAHYGKFFVENADDLAKQVSYEFDCNCTSEEAYPFLNTRTGEEEDYCLIYKNVMA